LNSIKLPTILSLLFVSSSLQIPFSAEQQQQQQRPRSYLQLNWINGGGHAIWSSPRGQLILLPDRL
jgi:hypothetical protein